MQGREYTVGPRGTPTMLNSLMYKMCYHDFGGLATARGQPTGYDRVRGSEIGEKYLQHPPVILSHVSLSPDIFTAVTACDSYLPAHSILVHVFLTCSRTSLLAHTGNKDFELEHIEEAFTSEHWIVRIYKVKDLDNRY